MANIIVLGGGMVGSAMAKDLSRDHQVTVADLNSDRLETLKEETPKLLTRILNVKDRDQLSAAISPHDLVISAVPGFLGYDVLSNIIDNCKDVVDISFFPENSLKLSEIARQNKVTAIVDCGVAPGMDNLILGKYNAQLQIQEFECLVGGLPKVKTWPFNYKAPFSPTDVIEEYTRPARYVQDGVIVTREALSEAEFIEFDSVGTLEAFNTDGLRSILFTMGHIPNMKEKTLRYPGHMEYIKALRKTGFFSEEPVGVNGHSIIPRDFTSTMLFKEWKLQPGEHEMTVMRVTIRGVTPEGITKTIIYDLLDSFDETSKTSSMARCTGYTATAAANLIINGLFREKGVFPPELFGHHDYCFDFIMEYLKNRGVIYHKKES